MNSGDLSPLFPLSIQDLVYLRVAREIQDDAQRKLDDLKFDCFDKCYAQLIGLLADLRVIQFAKLAFEHDWERQRAWDNLPSFGDKSKKTTVVASSVKAKQWDESI